MGTLFEKFKVYEEKREKMSLRIIHGKDDRIRFHEESANLNTLLKDEYDLQLNDEVEKTLINILNQNEKVSLIYNPNSRTIGYNKSRKTDSYLVLTLPKMKKQPKEVVQQYIQRFEALVNWLNLIISKEGMHD